MTLRVPFIPPKLTPTSTESNDIRNATPVRGGAQWQPMAEQLNWLLGRGGQIVGTGPVLPNQTITTGTTTGIFYHWPRSHHLTRLWLIGLRSTASTPPGYSAGTFRISTLSNVLSALYSVPSEDTQPTQIIEILEELTVSTVGALLFATTPTVGDTMMIDSIVCVEVPRHTLDSSAASLGIVADSCAANQPIFAPSTGLNDKTSAAGVYDQMVKAKTRTRRQKMFDQFRANGLTITTTAFTGTSNIYYVDPAVQTRHLNDSNTVEEVAWVVFAKVDSGTGEVRVTAASGDTTTLNITATTITAYTGVVDVETDDFSRADLIRGATRDTLTFEARNNTSTSITVYGISVGEAL